MDCRTLQHPVKDLTAVILGAYHPLASSMSAIAVAVFTQQLISMHVRVPLPLYKSHVGDFLLGLVSVWNVKT